ncbi:MAG TPA: hypothetical protein VNO21_22900 [Polyangiaceae bacterium]|nr:hypothetical protein [Polyangiaceae bacterium]
MIRGRFLQADPCSAPITFTLTGPFVVAAGDFDQDGNSDLVSDNGADTVVGLATGCVP